MSASCFSMASSAMSASSDHDDVVHKFRFFQVHKGGRVTLRIKPAKYTPPSEDRPVNGVRSKDVVVMTEPRVAARVFLPEPAIPGRTGDKFPVLFYVHGGGFCMHSPFNSIYHDFVANIAVKSGAIAVSVDYGLFPGRSIPGCYDDCWSALRWVAAHTGWDGPEPWLNRHADLRRVFIAGDSSGGNIAHDLVARVGRVGFPGLTVSGAVLIHPYFGGTKDDEMMMYMDPDCKGLDDPRVRPTAEDLARIGCGKVLVFVAERDSLVGPGKRYVDDLRKSRWKGTVEMVESLGEGHWFFFNKIDPNYKNTADLVNKFVAFIKDGMRSDCED